jgi:GMP synthase (glutamine-hydrolysing)
MASLQTQTQIAILKTGSTFPTLAATRGDFEDWILAGMGLSRHSVLIIDAVAHQAAFPAYDTLAGVVITGSHAIITEHHPWSERAANWIRQVVERRIPVLGICYGHQLLAYAFGGDVDNNPNGREFGTTTISVHNTAASDPLFQHLPSRFSAHVSHRQSVLRLPPEATRLASSSMDAYQAFVFKEWAWGVQFHPEFDVEITREYIKACASPLQAQGIDPHTLSVDCCTTPESTSLLKIFRTLIEQKQEEEQSKN